MNKEDGGPAFPEFHEVWTDCEPANADGSYPKIRSYHVDHGMSLRDYFAAAALSGMIYCIWQKEGLRIGSDQFSRAAYEMADAMLAEREPDK